MFKKVINILITPLKSEYLMLTMCMKSVVMLICVLWLIVSANAAAVEQPQVLNYKQQLQYQMQQHDKFEYQQHLKQQQHYYQQQYHQQQKQQQQQHQQEPQLQPTSMALQQEQQQQQYHHQQYLPAQPTQMIQSAASLKVDDGIHAEALGQSEYPNGNAQRRRPGTRKRKRRPQISSVDASAAPTAESHTKYWRGQVEDDKAASHSAVQPEEEIKPSLQTSFRRRKQPAIREPLAALEKEQKLYELRNKPDTSSEIKNHGSNVHNLNSANLKNILKNNGGLSLSEILQQKNLSLDDLLKGKQNALQALQTTAEVPVQKSQGMKYPTKPKFKLNTPPAKLTDGSGEEMDHSRERNKLTALHRLKLFGSSSRPSGIQVGLADHLTTRRKEGSFTTTLTTTTTTTLAPSTTRIPLYKKILQQRPTLKSSFLLKNTVMTSAEPDRVITSWDSKEQENSNKEEGTETEENAEDIQDEEEEEYRDDTVNNSEDITQLPELIERTNFKEELTTEKPTPRQALSTTKRMYSTTRGLTRTVNRFTTSTTTTTPPPTTTSSTTTTTTCSPLPMTTTTTTSTTTASSSTMNLTPKANLNLNTEDLRERIQETLLKNFIEKEDSLKNTPLSEETDNEDDLENFFEETPRPRTTKYLETSTITTRMKQFSISPKPTESLNVIPDFDNVDDRTDLLELIEDRRSGNRLFKVLEQRNMTLEELIEHRKRGSSQLHLATIVNTPSRFYPDKTVVLQDNMDIVTAFENFPHFNLLNLKSVKPDDIKTDSQGSSYFTSIIDIEPTDEIYKTNKGLPASSSLSSDVDKVALLPDRSEKSLGFFPSWKTLALASLATTTTNNNNKDVTIKRNPFFLVQPKMLLDNISDNDDDDDNDEYNVKENELALMTNNDTTDEDEDYQAQNPIQAAVRLPDQTAEAIENEVARAHDLVDLELSGHGFKRSPQTAGALAHSHKRGSFYTNMPAGIKSAIVASATIVLTALVTFMVIFGVCRWKQKRHRMTNIMKSYNAMKSKLPTIATTTLATTTNPNSRRSSCRDLNNLLGGSGLSVAATITTTSSSSAAGMPNTPPPLTSLSQATTMLAGQNHNSCGQNSKHQLQRQSSLLFQRSMNTTNNENPTNLAILSGSNLLDIKRNNNNNNNNNNNMRGSTTSLSFSLTSGHNISNSHINTVDATSPEVQEYLFDTLRNSF